MVRQKPSQFSDGFSTMALPEYSTFILIIRIGGGRARANSRTKRGEFTSVYKPEERRALSTL
jgi:hypothetical protein